MIEFLNAIYYGNSVLGWLKAISIAVFAYIIGKLIYWVIGSFVKKLTAKTKTKLDDILVDMIEEPIMFGIILTGAWIGISTLTLVEGLKIFLGHAFSFIIVINVTWFISRLFEAIWTEYIVPLAERSENDLDDQLLPVIRKAVKITIWTLGIIIGLDNIGFDVGAVLAGLGIGGLLLAMAAKDTVANFFGGITIYADKPFKLKDRIKVNGYDGTVTEIGLRSTRIKTLAGTQVVIPNSTFSDQTLENISREPTRKITLNLGLTYDTTPTQMKKAMNVLEDIAKNNEHINASYKIGFNAFGDFSLGIIFIYYIKKGSDILGTQNEINLEILEKFNKNKLDMAFPTQTIELKK